MIELVYGLCALTAAGCATVLLRAWSHSRARLLLWSGLCFAGLTLNNVLLILDLYVVASIDLSVARTGTALVAMIVLVFGLVTELR